MVERVKQAMAVKNGRETGERETQKKNEREDKGNAWDIFPKELPFGWKLPLTSAACDVLPSQL